jgi:hypothetical protein
MVSWRLDTGSWRLEAGGWRLDGGYWRLEARCWILVAVMKKCSLLVSFQLICVCLVAQEEYPLLTNIISFDALQKKSIKRRVEWRNPDGTKEEMNIIEMAVPFGEAMKEHTKAFVYAVYGLDSIWLKPKMIVFHAMGDGDLKTSLEVSSFLNDQIPESWGTLSKAGALPNGAHFIVDRDGTIICLSPPVSNADDQFSFERDHHHWFIKRHQDGNPVAIGIENVTPRGDYTSLTREQITSNAKLARWLIWFENGEIEFVTGHHQFNDDKNYDQFLQYFHLKNLKMQFRTKGRKDIGDKNLTEILKRIQSFGIPIKNFFIPN